MIHRVPTARILALGVSATATALLASSCAGAPPPEPAEAEDSARFFSKGAETLAAGDSASGMLRVSDPINPRDGSPYRTYRIALEQDQVVHVEAQSSEYAPGVALLGPDGTLVGAAAADQTSGGRSQLVRRIPSAGEYYLVVSSDGGGNYGAYDLTTELLERDQTVEFPGSVDGFLYGGGRSHPKTNAPMSVYPLELDEATAVDIAMRSQDFDTYLSVVDAGSERVLSENDDGGAGTGTNSRIIAELPAGSYEVWASALRPDDSEGEFTLNLAVAEVERSESFAIGEPYKGFLGIDRQSVPGTPRTGHAVEFEVDEPVILRATMRAAALDPFLVLTDASGRKLAEDDDSAGERNARLLHPVEPGSYVLYASSYSQNESGPFQIETSLVEGSDESSLSLGASIRAVLTQGDETYAARGSHIRYYDIELDSAQTVQLDMASQDFDTFLVLEDDMGNTVAENDDASPGTTDSRINRHLEAGSYRVGATSYPPAGSGVFTLRATAPGGSGR